MKSVFVCKWTTAVIFKFLWPAVNNDGTQESVEEISSALKCKPKLDIRKNVEFVLIFAVLYTYYGLKGAGPNSFIVPTSIGICLYWCFLIACYFFNCHHVCRVRPVFKFLVVVQFQCAITQPSFDVVAFNHLFQFNNYGGHSRQHAERFTWCGSIRLCH